MEIFRRFESIESYLGQRVVEDLKLVFALALGGFFVDTEVFAAGSPPMQTPRHYSWLRRQALDRAEGYIYHEFRQKGLE